MDNNNIENNAVVNDTANNNTANNNGNNNGGINIASLSDEELFTKVTDTYGDKPLSWLVKNRNLIAAELMDKINQYIDNINHGLPSKMKRAYVRGTMPVTCAAKLILASGDVRLVRMSTSTADGVMAVVRDYDSFGNFTGIWLMDREGKEHGALYNLVRSIMGTEARRSAIEQCRDVIIAELKKGKIYPEGWSKDLIVFFDGVWNGKTREFTYFTDPDYEQKYGQYTFLSKMDTSWNPLAQQKSYFPVLEFIRSTMPDGELGDLQYQAMLHTIQFLMRRYPGAEGWIVEYINDLKRAKGHGGKSTLIQLILGIIEHTIADVAYASRIDQKELGNSNGAKVAVIPVDKWDKQFALSGIIGAWAILSDDASDVAIEDGVFKKVARGLALDVDRKYMDGATYIAHLTAFILMNGMLKFKDKKDSMFSHQLPYSMDKEFTKENGTIDTKIKSQYIGEEETWEYLAHYAATQVEWLDDYPDEMVEAMHGAIDQMKRQNIPTYRMLDDIMPLLKGVARIPLECIYDLTYGWRSINGVTYSVDLNKFEEDVAQWISEHQDEWAIDDKKYDRLSTKYKLEMVPKGAPKTAYTHASELDLLAKYKVPAVLRYGQPTKEYGERPTIQVLHETHWHASGGTTQTCTVTGLFNESVLKGKKFKTMIVNLQRVQDHNELFDDEN